MRTTRHTTKEVEKNLPKMAIGDVKAALDASEGTHLVSRAWCKLLSVARLLPTAGGVYGEMVKEIKQQRDQLKTEIVELEARPREQELMPTGGGARQRLYDELLHELKQQRDRLKREVVDLQPPTKGSKKKKSAHMTLVEKHALWLSEAVQLKIDRAKMGYYANRCVVRDTFGDEALWRPICAALTDATRKYSLDQLNLYYLTIRGGGSHIHRRNIVEVKELYGFRRRRRKKKNKADSHETDSQ